MTGGAFKTGNLNNYMYNDIIKKLFQEFMWEKRMVS